MTTPRAPSASPSARSDAGVLALCVASLLARFALASSGYADALASRVELATPADALARTREGWALATIGVSPYRGSQCHAPPLARTSFLRALYSGSSSVTAPKER